MHKSKGAAGILAMTIIIAIATTFSYFGYRYYTANSLRIVKESKSRDFAILLQKAMNDRKAAVMRRYSSRPDFQANQRAADYYAFFPETLSQLVTEGYLNLTDTGFKLVESDVNGSTEKQLYIVDSYNRPILYFRSSLAEVPYNTTSNRRGCQFEYFKIGGSADDLDVLVPSVVVVIPGGRFLTQERTAATETAIASYNKIYNDKVSGHYLDFDNNTHFTQYNAAIVGQNLWTLDEIRNSSVDQEFIASDLLLAFDATTEYVALDQKVQTNIASVADNFVSRWRSVYVRKLTDLANNAQMSPEQYLVVASTRLPSQTDQWPVMLKQLCQETNEEVFGAPKSTIQFRYVESEVGSASSENNDLAIYALNNFSTENHKSLKTNINQGHSAKISPFVESFEYDSRWLTVQDISALSQEAFGGLGYYPGISLEMKCACRVQSEQSVPCEELSEYFLDERDVFIREMFLEVRRMPERSECPWYSE